MRYGGATVMGTAGLTLAGIGGYAWPHPAQASTGEAGAATAPTTPGDSGGVLHFVTRPDLTPPAITVSHHGHPAADDPPYFIKAGSQRRTGFETMITVNSAGPYFAVTANDASGHVLGQSRTVQLAS